MQSLSRCCLFLLSFCLVSFARGQLISFSVKNESLEKVFLLIEKQSGYNFIYSTEQVRKANPVTLSVTGQQLVTVLDKCFQGQPLQYSLDARHIVVRGRPEKTLGHSIRGTITNEKGEVLEGITVTVKNTGQQSATDSKGNFFIDNVPPDFLLQISGAEIESQEIPAGKSDFINIVVQAKLGTLDETIIIAYGKTTRRTTTGSISKVSREEITQQPVSNFLGAIAGRVTGMQITQQSGMPGAAYTVRLRGQNSIANGNDPLYIVDGIPFPSASLNGISGAGFFSSPLNTINIADIESIEVLKDAEATAIYGSRGANGVILITTRRGVQGDLKTDARFTAGVGRVTRFMDMLSTQEYLRMRREGFANDNVTPTIANARDLLVWDSTKNTHWQKELIGHTMHSFDSRVEVSGGNANTQFLAGVTYRKETTILPRKEFGEEKSGGQVSINHKTANKRWTFSFQSSLLKTRLLSPESDISSYVALPPNAPALFNANGTLNWDNPTWGNPYQSMLRPVRSETNNLLVSTTVTGKIIADLEARISFGYNLIGVQERSKAPIASYDPTFTPVPIANFGSTNLQNMIIEPQLSYRKNFAALSLHFLTGASLQSNQYNSLQQSGSGYSSDELMNSLRAAAVITTGAEVKTRYRYAAFFGRISADWSGKYLLSLTGRRDGSSRYAPSNRFADFGSVGLGWIFTREKGLNSLSWLSFGKLRASIGITGNDQIGDYRYLNTYSTYSYTYQGVVPFIPAQLYSPAFTWEKVIKREAAIDIGLLKDRLLLSVNYYNNTTGNQLVSYALPTMTGFSGVLKNLPATVNNYGWEAELTVIPVRQKKFNWTVAFNISVPKNKLVRFDDIASSTYATTYVVGQSLFIAKRYELTGVDPATGLYTYTDYNRDGVVNAGFDRQKVVFTGQQYYGGLEQSFIIGNIRTGFLLQFVRHRRTTTVQSSLGRPGTFANQPAFVVNRWRQAGDISDIQRISFSSSAANTAFSNFLSSDGNYDDASFIRLKNLYFNWSPFSKQSRIAVLKGLVFSITGQNLLTITRYKSFDPETRTFLPPLRVLTGGIQLTF